MRPVSVRSPAAPGVIFNSYMMAADTKNTIPTGEFIDVVPRTVGSILEGGGVLAVITAAVVLRGIVNNPVAHVSVRTFCGQRCLRQHTHDQADRKKCGKDSFLCYHCFYSSLFVRAWQAPYLLVIMMKALASGSAPAWSNKRML